MGSDLAERRGDAADQLNEAICELEDVDLNPLIDDDVRALLAAKDTLTAICLRLRQDQHAGEGGDGR